MRYFSVDFEQHVTYLFKGLSFRHSVLGYHFILKIDWIYSDIFSNEAIQPFEILDFAIVFLCLLSWVHLQVMYTLAWISKGTCLRSFIFTVDIFISDLWLLVAQRVL